VKRSFCRLSPAPDHGRARTRVLPVLSGVPTGTNRVRNRKKLSQTGPVLPMSKLIIYRSPGQTPFPQRMQKLVFAFVFYTTASLASNKHKEIKTFKEKQRK